MGEKEEGFVFLPDAFIAKAVGPRAKILAARRMAARADLLAVNYAALLYGWLEGARPAETAALREHGVLAPTDLEDADGRPIAFDPEQGASSAWGRPNAIPPGLRGALQWAFAIGEKAGLRKELDRLDGLLEFFAQDASQCGFVNGMPFLDDERAESLIDHGLVPCSRLVSQLPEFLQNVIVQVDCDSSLSSGGDHGSPLAF